MSHEILMTSAVEEAVNNLWRTHVTNSVDDLNAATDIIAFLNDVNNLNTVAFVLKRYLHENHHLIGQRYPWPWTAETIDKVSYLLSKQTPIVQKEWKQWLSSKKSMGRETAFKIAHYLKMGIEDLLELLSAIDGELINFRAPGEFVHYFFLAKGMHKYEAAEGVICDFEEHQNRLNEAWNKPEETGVIERDITLGYTRFAEDALSRMINTSPPESGAIENLKQFMYEHAEQFQGFSLSNVGRLLRLSQYLYKMYPTYYKVSPPNKKQHKETVSWEEVKLDKYGIPNLTDLCYAFMGMDYKSTRGADKKLVVHQIEHIHQDLYAHSRKVFANIFAKGKETSKSYPNIQPVKRSDVLLFAFFFIVGYEREINPKDLPKVAENAELPKHFQAILDSGIWEDFDAEMMNVMTKLRGYIARPSYYSNSRVYRKFITDVVNSFLTMFGYPPLYVPNPFDRFILLCLLSDCPVGVWSEILYGDEAEEDNEEEE